MRIQRSVGVLIVVACVTACVTLSSAQKSLIVIQPKLTPQSSGTTQLLIAVSPVNTDIVWAAGAHGTFLLTTDGGKTWKSGTVKGTENLQFRDVQGVSATVAYLQSIGTQPNDFVFTKRRTAARLGRKNFRTI